MKELLLDILRAWERKLLNDECTAEDIRECSKIITDNVDVLVTAKDLSEIYGKPLPSVKTCLSRNGLQSKNPPKVRKFYSLLAFRKVKPKTWVSRENTPPMTFAGVAV